VAASAWPATAERYQKLNRSYGSRTRPAQKRNGSKSRPTSWITAGHVVRSRRTAPAEKNRGNQRERVPHKRLASACSPSELADHLSFTTPPPAGVQLESPAWYVHRQRLRPVVDPGPAFSTATFHGALATSPLRSKAKYTLLEMLHSADEFGRTTVSGRRLAGHLGVREATISSHLEKARIAKLLLTKRRYNKSSSHQLTWPGSGLHPPHPGVSPLRTHTWTDGETAWWSSLDTGSRRPTPWGDHHPPF
jgi:hypothetical protein